MFFCLLPERLQRLPGQLFHEPRQAGQRGILVIPQERDDIGAHGHIPHKYLVYGHTPTPYYTGVQPEDARIYRMGKLIGIDCGCESGQLLRQR